MKDVINPLWPALAAFAFVLPAPAQQLGPAPHSDAEETFVSSPFALAEDVAVNPNDRIAVINLYRNVYLASQSATAGWTGNRNTCNAGTTSQGYADATLLRVNYYRAMAGLPGSVTLSNTWNGKCQEAALMMSAAGRLSHSPDTSWPCSTANGREAAGRSNLALGAAGPGAIDLYIDDPGSGNSAAGHRRWILYPPAKFMGTGSVPPSGGSAANALWVIGGAGTRPATPAWVAWPPPGFVPYPVLPRISQRWSFSYPGASFSTAKVFMHRAGAPVTLTIEPMAQGYGDNTIVWVPQGVPSTVSSDTTYTVLVSNVVVSSQARQFTYEVTIIDPDTLAPVVITRGPESRTNAVGSATVFSVTASGPTPLSYQWRKNGVNLVSGGRISGATSANLGLSSIQMSDAGGYDVVVAHASQSVTSAPPARLWVVDTTPPTVLINSPLPRAVVEIPGIAVRGTAHDNVGVASVEFRVVNASYTNSWQPAVGTSNWTAAVTNLAIGSNSIRVRARDGHGNVSAVIDLPIAFYPRSELKLTTSGNGALAPFPSSTNLVVGKPYTLTAAPAPGCVFSNWAGAFGSGSLSPLTNSPQITFLMQTGLWLHANFAVSPFLEVKGTYNGLFYAANGVEPESSGFFSLSVGGRGGYTARLRMGGVEYSTSGELSLDGKATDTIQRTPTNCLNVEWVLDLDGARTNVLTGRVLDCGGAWVAGLLGDRAPVYGPAEVSPYAGKYTFLIPGTHDPARNEEPAGDGFGLVTVTSNGVASVNGVLADGKVFSQSVPVSTNGLWPLHVSLYGGGGSLMGWVRFDTNLAPGCSLSSERVSWIRPERSQSAYFPEGFVIETALWGSGYKAKYGVPFTNGILSFTGGGLETPLTHSIRLTSTNTVVLCGSESVAATVTRSNGPFVGTFTLPNTNTVVTFKGALLQRQGFGSGYFKNAGESGWVYLGPAE